jgi:hypothetical protein
MYFALGLGLGDKIQFQSKDNDLDSPIEKARTPALSPLESFSSGLLELSLL